MVHSEPGVHRAPNAPSRHFAATQQLGRFRSEADIERFSVCADSVAFGPFRPFAATQQLGRFPSEADIERFSVCIEPVANDP